MFQYEKALQYPVKIARPNARLAKMVMSQLGGLNSKKIYKSRQRNESPAGSIYTLFSLPLYFWPSAVVTSTEMLVSAANSGGLSSCFP